MRRAASLLAAGAAVAVTAGAAGGTPIATPNSSTPKATYVTNGAVDAIVDTGTVTYIGGQFTEVGPRTGPGVGISASTGNDLGLAQVSGGGNTVDAVAPDGSGGFYIGGDFTHVGGLARRNIAHIRSDGTVDPSFDPSPDTGQINAIAVSGSTVYVGGAFNIIGGQSRSNIAALDASTGDATSWDPDANGTVRALAVSGSTVYAGGDFNNYIGGAPRSYAVALDATTGLATSWNPSPGASVYSLLVSGSTVYLGGDFGAHVEAVDSTTGTTTIWSGGPNGRVYTMALVGGKLYAGGLFLTWSGAYRYGLADVDATTGVLDASWAPDPYFAVAALTASGTTLYAGGAFGTMFGQTRSGLAAFDTTTGNLESWNPNPDNEVLALATSGSTVYAGGIFSMIGGVQRNFAAAIDDSTGNVTSWDPEANSTVLSLAAAGSTVYAGGTFTTIGGAFRSRLAALDASTGVATSWNPSPDGQVDALAVSGSTIYAGGTFQNIGAVTPQPRPYLAALDASTGAALLWNPSPDDSVDALVVSGSTVYAGGTFANVDGHSHSRLVAIDASGAPASWDAGVSGTFGPAVDALAVSGSTVYAGGSFTSIGGQSRNDLAALDGTTGTATSWDPNANHTVNALAVFGSVVYAGGSFTSIGGQTRDYLAGLDVSGNATGIDPEPNSDVDALAVAGNTLDVGGQFTGFDLGASQGFAQFTLVEHTLTVTKSGAGSGTVTSSPTGIDCGGTCSQAFDTGTTITLAATAAAGSTFSGWSGGGCAGTGDCHVTLGADTTVNATFVSGTFSPPTVTSFSPPSGGGIHATVTVTGTNFTGATSVKLNSVGAAFTVVDATHLTFTVPTGATTGLISVTNPAGTGTSASPFTVFPAPTISAPLSPTSGPVGTAVTITGTNLSTTVAVALGSILMVPTSVSSTQVVFTVPPGAVTGTVKVLATGGEVSAGTFTVTP